MIRLTRRALLAGLAAVPVLPAGAATEPRFSFEALKRRAAALARQPWRPQPPVPGAAAIDYDAAGTIRFRPERTLFGDRPGAVKVRLFAPSVTAQQAVAINLVEDGRVRPVAIDGGWFAAPAGVTVPAGTAGFRAMNPGADSDWLAFLGASYFRSAGSQDQYGLSARAIAIDTGIDGAERFPAFTEFWLSQEAAGTLVIHALLDGEAVTGAFRFACRLGPQGVTQEVDAFLRLRRDVARLGLAPATSMFWYGEKDRVRATDWRPEVHDSDGLAIAMGTGERLWRPLVNPPRPIVSSFTDRDPRGFGLLQRDRAENRYLDDAVYYERRPGLWITPRGSWGPGAVQLYAFPTRSEVVDNVVAWWTPAAPARRDATYEYGYRLDWSSREPEPATLARVGEVYQGDGGVPGSPPTPGVTKIVADFAGGALTGLGLDAGVTIDAAATRARIVSALAYPLAYGGGRWRAMVEIADVSAGEPAELRMVLRHGGRPASETLLVQHFA